MRSLTLMRTLFSFGCVNSLQFGYIGLPNLSPPFSKMAAFLRDEISCAAEKNLRLGPKNNFAKRLACITNCHFFWRTAATIINNEIFIGYVIAVRKTHCKLLRQCFMN